MAYFANGTEGAMFEEDWCQRCIHSDYRDGKGIGDADNPPCPVWVGHILFAYELCNEKENPGKVILDLLIADRGPGVMPECKMFALRPGAPEIVGQEILL